MDLIPPNTPPAPPPPLGNQKLFDKCVRHLLKQSLPATREVYSTNEILPVTFAEGRTSPLTFLLRPEDLRSLRNRFSWEMVRDMRPDECVQCTLSGGENSSVGQSQRELYASYFEIMRYRGVDMSMVPMLASLESRYRDWARYWINAGADPARPCHAWLASQMRQVAMTWSLDASVCNFDQP